MSFSHKKGHSGKSSASKPYFPSGKKSPQKKNNVVPGSRNKKVEPDFVKDDVFAKVPVVLAETVVQIDMDGKIEFPEPVLEIKTIKKSLRLTQCRLLLPTNKLFIRGFVRKNIQYATPIKSKDGILSEIHSLTVDMPFETVTEIDFISKPQFMPNPDQKEFTYFKQSKLPQPGFSQKEKLLSGDFTQFDQISGEVFNELPFCELLSSRFIEYDESLDRKMGHVMNKCDEWIDSGFSEGTFTEVEEKMVVELKLKVLQNQQVRIHSQKHKRDHDHYDY